MTPKIIGLDGKEHDWAYLTGKYGRLEVLTPNTYPVFRLIQIEEMQGPALCQVQVVDAQGRPALSQPVALSWPDPGSPAGDLPNIAGSSRNLWFARGVIQRVDASGTTGFGLGSGSWIRDLAAGGPYSVQVISPSTYSECFAHFGWLGGTDHMGPCRLTFQEVLQPAVEPPPPGPGGNSDSVLAAINETNRVLGLILAEVRSLAQHLGA